MSTSANHLHQRLQDEAEAITRLMPTAITLATMVRHRAMAAWLRTEFEGYGDPASIPTYRAALPGHLVANSPQYGWIPAPIDDDQKTRHNHLDVGDSIKELERVCLNCKKGNGHRVTFDDDTLRTLQKQVNLTATLALTINRDTYCRVIRVVRGAVYLWCQALLDHGLTGEHNAYTSKERQQVAHLDTPEAFWRKAVKMDGELPVPDVREVGFLQRVFGRTG